MSNATAETLTVDGVSLSTYAWNVTTRGDRMAVGAAVGSNVAVPGRHGTIWNNLKTFPENVLVLSMWALGANSDGSIPSGTQRAACVENLDALVRLFGKRYALLHVVQTMPDGSERECYGEVVKQITFSTMAGATRAEFTVEIVVPDAFWQDTSALTYDSGSGVTSGQQLTIPMFDGATAPMDDFVYVVSGPATNPRVTVLPTGDWIQLNGTLATGTDWQIDSSQWRSVTGAALGFGSGGVSVIATTQRSGGGRMLVLPPYQSAEGALLEFTATGPGAGTRIRIQGRRKYLMA